MSNTPRVPSDPPRRGRFWRCVALLVALIGLGLVAGLGGCQPKKTLSDAGDTVSQYAKGLGGSATKVGTRTGELIGLVEKKWDYVRLAYGAGETPVKLQAEYTLEEEREAGRAMGLEFTGHYGRYRNAQLDR